MVLEVCDFLLDLNCITQLNASDDRGIGVVREQVLTFASTKTLFSYVVSRLILPFSGKFKLIILDEADAMTKDAQNALRRSKLVCSFLLLFC